MIEYLVGACLMLLTIGHAILIHGCMKWAVERRATTSMIDDRLATLATLIDEALDLFSEVSDGNSVASQSLDVRAMLTNMVLDRLSIRPGHAPQESEAPKKDIEVQESSEFTPSSSGSSSSERIDPITVRD